MTTQKELIDECNSQYFEWIHAVIIDIRNETTSRENGIEKVILIDKEITKIKQKVIQN